MKRFFVLTVMFAIFASGCAGRAPLLDRVTDRPPEPAKVPEEITKLQRGFTGTRKYHSDKPTRNEVVLLEQTVRVGGQGEWAAWGLTRNELNREVGHVVVTARLVGKDGNLLDKPSSLVPVDPLRPGEPGPFMLRSKVPGANVARVEWSIAAGEPNRQATRDLETQWYWHLPYGIAEPRPGLRRDDPPYPYVLAAGFHNRDGYLADSLLVAAWLDRDGRVLWVETTGMSPEFKRPLPPDTAANFNKIEVYDPDVGPQLYEADYMLWTVGIKAGQ